MLNRIRSIFSIVRSIVRSTGLLLLAFGSLQVLAADEAVRSAPLNLTLPSKPSTQYIPFGPGIMDTFSQIQERAGGGYRPACSGKVDSFGNRISCGTSGDYFKKHTIVKMDYENYNDIPPQLKPFIKTYTPESFRAQFKSVSFFFIIQNDNRQLVGLGTKENPRYGDDFGDTALAGFGLSGLKENGVRYQLSFESGLFTTPVPGTFSVDDKGTKSMSQNYLNQNVLKLVIDNIEAGKTQFWTAEAGFVQITNSNRLGILEGSKQQSVFHSFLNRQNPHLAYNFKNVEDGSKDRYGAYVGLLTGLQSHLKLGDSCFVEAETYAGVKVSTLPKDSFVNTGAKTTVGFQIPSLAGKIQISLDVNVKSHSEGQLRSITQGIAYVSNRGTTVGFQITSQSGNLINTTGKNIPNIYTSKPDTKIGFYFSKPLK